MSSPSPLSLLLRCAAVLFLASASCVSAAVDNPAFKTRLGIPCTTIEAGGLDCRQFGLLGMTDREVQELVDNCPCACKDFQCNATEENMIKTKPLSFDTIKETASPGPTVQQEPESTEQIEDEVLPENAAPSTTPDAPVPTKTNAPTTTPTAAPTSPPTPAPSTVATTAKNPSLRSKPSIMEAEEETVEQEVVAGVPEAEGEKDIVDLLKEESTREEQPAAIDTTGSSASSPKKEVNNDMMPVTPNDDGTFIVAPESSGRVSKTVVKFIVSASLLVAAFVVFHLYRKFVNTSSDDEGKSDGSDGTMSRDETMSDCEVPSASISGIGTNEGVEVLDP